MAIIKKTRNNKYWRGCGERGTFIFFWWDYKLVQPLWKTERTFLKKLRIQLPHDPAIPLLDIYPKDTKTLIQKDKRSSVFTAVLFTIIKIWKPTCPLKGKQIKKLRYVHTREYYSTTKRMKSYHLWQHGWTLRALCQVKWKLTPWTIQSLEFSRPGYWSR